MQSNVYYAGFRQFWPNWVTIRNGKFSLCWIHFFSLPTLMIYRTVCHQIQGFSLTTVTKQMRDSEILQNDLDKLQEWDEKWIMSVIPDKCEVLCLTLKHQNIIHASWQHIESMDSHWSLCRQLSIWVWLLTLNWTTMNMSGMFVRKQIPPELSFIAHQKLLKQWHALRYVRPQLEYALHRRCGVLTQHTALTVLKAWSGTMTTSAVTHEWLEPT